ncbi:hypothetical protein [Simplicispira piscis]|jgi:hypothetical protein
MNQNDDQAPMFARSAHTPRNDKAELRMMVPVRLMAIFDAVSLARNQERFELVLEELSKSADRWEHEATLIHRVTRGNPSLSDTNGEQRHG